MKKRGLEYWVQEPKTRQILMSFSLAKTPRQIEKELGIKKLKVKSFLEKELIRCLNPNAKKGRLYTLTKEAKTLLKLPDYNSTGIDWDLIGWVLASPRQRLVSLTTISMDHLKRTSEQIRKRAARYNPCFSRISTKEILKELISKDLVETELDHDGRRYYWISENGSMVMGKLETLLRPEKYEGSQSNLHS